VLTTAAAMAALLLLLFLMGGGAGASSSGVVVDDDDAEVGARKCARHLRRTWQRSAANSPLATAGGPPRNEDSTTPAS
jgi:hypothetical protein